MTTLEGILIAILWASYGAFAAFQTDRDNPWNEDDGDGEVLFYTIYIMFAPVVLVIKMLYGAFKKYE